MVVPLAVPCGTNTDSGYPHRAVDMAWAGGEALVHERRGVQVTDVRLSQRLCDLGVVQRGAGILDEAARSSSLPAERDEVEQSPTN